jgi:ketosteroid isomerase-like protein
MRSLFIFSLFLCCSFVHAQKAITDTGSIKVLIDSVNSGIDNAVVRKDLSFLQLHYADDFRFIHATGVIDSKSSWMNNVKTNRMLSRSNDSVLVELHGNLAVVTGTLTVRFPKETARKGYAVRYVRVFTLKGKLWQLVSHHSTAEWDVEDN